MDLFCQCAGVFVTDILVIEVVTVEFGRVGEPAPVLLAIGESIAVRVYVSRVGSVEAVISGRYVSILIQVGPVPVELKAVSGGEVDSVGVGVAVAVVGVGWIESIDELPAVGHSVEVRIKGCRVDWHDIHVTARRDACEYPQVPAVLQSGQGCYQPGYLSLVEIQTEDTRMATLKAPRPISGTDDYHVVHRQY